MRAVTRALAVAASVAVAAGCNMILGNDVHDLDRDAASATGGAGGEGGSTSGGAGGATGGAGQGGNAGQAGAAGEGGAAGQGGAAGRGGAGGIAGSAGQGGSAGRDAGIDDGAGGTTHRDVSIDGVTNDSGTPGDGAIHDGNDDAADSCTPNSTECRGRSLYLCTATGAWVETLQCPYACVTGACGGNCVPGTVQCTGNIPQTCDDTGKWQSGAACPYVCALGACTGTCIPGSTKSCGDVTTCNAAAIQTCDGTGTLGACIPAPSTCSAVPSGWQPVALTQSTTCPSGFGAAQTVYTSATGAPYTCSCGCTGSQSCTGSATLKHFAGDAGMCSDPSTTTRSLNFGSACTGGSFGSIVTGNAYQLATVSYEPGPTCASTPTPTTQPPVVAQTATLCTPNLACPSGACLAGGEESNLCVYKLGTQSCPQGFPNATVIAGSYDDSRTCSQCVCASKLTCTINGVILYNDGTCTPSGPYVMTASTACSFGPSNYPINAVQADGTSANDPNCVESTPSSPVGSVALNGASTATVCCR